MHKKTVFQSKITAAQLAFITILITSGFHFNCQQQPPVEVTDGVSLQLAQQRAAAISVVRYSLHFTIPDSLSQAIRGTAVLNFHLSDRSQPLVLDFNPNTGDVLAAKAGDVATAFDWKHGHIVISPDALREGQNSITVAFIAGEGPLNRTQHFLYTLFVPDRASETFPCFDQPNIKAKYQLSLELPPHWTAVANGALLHEKSRGHRRHYTFAETELLPTYLFAFAAGEFEKITAQRNGRTLEMFHRETDSTKITRNSAAIFDLHAQAIAWLEDYTGIPYPFGKFGFVLIPSFQYGGMEHPGAILYRASRLLLDASATQSDILGRASLIAHETAHIWFGDLVTMDWFDDVWMKEVFANFMAAKIANPAFPELDHELRFLLAHYPAAYAVDRSDGANPIRQHLDNLNDAGSLYGAIIYQKAPIVMRQLERLVGEQLFRDGMREYLSKFAFANATWPQLIDILDQKSSEDMRAWSRVWVGEPGMPTIEISRHGGADSLFLQQTDMAGKGRLWGQNVSVLFAKNGKMQQVPLAIRSEKSDVPIPAGFAEPDFVLAKGDASGYRYFALDAASRDFLLKNAHRLDDPLVRANVLLSLWEEMLRQKVAPEAFLRYLTNVLQSESNTQIIQRALGYLGRFFWQFQTSESREQSAPALENLLWHKIHTTDQQNLKSAYFRAFRDLAISSDGVGKLLRIWQSELTITGLSFSENDETTLAMELAVRDIPQKAGMLQTQLERISNSDRVQRLRFVLPALSGDASERDAFFESLKEVKNRHREAWVLTALGYLHHPLRAEHSQKYLRTSLELLEEIQRSGDIFFPKRWLDATLGGHNSAQAAQVVAQFLQERPDYPPRLRGKILQSADLLFRAAKILHGW